MNLRKKKILAAKALGVGKNKVYFNPDGISEIKEAITKQDIQSLYNEGLIRIKPSRGRKQKKKRTTRRGSGKIKIKVRNRKRDYIIITRKLRRIAKHMLFTNSISKDSYYLLRKKIKMKSFKNTTQFKEFVDKIEDARKKSEQKANPKKETAKKINAKSGGKQHETSQKKKN